MLITRPLVDAQRLAGMLATIGIDSIIQPAQEFRSRNLEATELGELTTLEPPFLLIFTSPRAVDYGLPQVPPAVSMAAKIAAIGPATARALAAAGKSVQFESEHGYSSESLLKTLAREADQNGGNALVLCAQDAREVLIDRLGECGWTARSLWVYKRLAAEIQPETLQAIESAERLLTVFTSAEAMNSLSQRLPPSAWYRICRGQWLVISERLQRLARAFGPPEIHLANGPRNVDLATAIRSFQ